MGSLATLNFRASPVGGDITVDEALIEAQRLRGHENLIFLIHGYNNTTISALNAYTAFADRQQALVASGRSWTADATLVQVFWPGDADWGLASAAYYPFAVPRAQAVADAFANIISDLAQHSSALTVQLVAHSLGNRLLLRALALLADAKVSDVWVRRTVHMAAAVPVGKLEDPSDVDELAIGLVLESKDPARALSLYSPSDDVLAYAFRLGESVTTLHDGILPIALGHDQWASSATPGGLKQSRVLNAAHSDYWGSKDRPDWQSRESISLEAARQAAAHLEMANVITRGTPAAVALVRTTGSGEPQASRATPTRSAGPASP